ncbi:hypothetical protein BH11CYA1_BH11CYA1_09840 [soil metagenome]
MEANTTKLEITPLELKKRLDAGEKPFVLDIREAHELEICALNNSAHIPMGELPQRFQELAEQQEQEIIIYCRSGARSDRCAGFLRSQGFKNVLNLTGGILRWSDDVDSSLTKY